MQEKPFFIILTKRMMNVIRKMLALLFALGMLGGAVCHGEEWNTFADRNLEPGKSPAERW